MNGIILYADDDVLNSKSSENKLFQKFNNSTEYSVLPITNLEDLEKLFLVFQHFGHYYLIGHLKSLKRMKTCQI